MSKKKNKQKKVGDEAADIVAVDPTSENSEISTVADPEVEASTSNAEVDPEVELSTSSTEVDPSTNNTEVEPQADAPEADPPVVEHAPLDPETDPVLQQLEESGPTAEQVATLEELRAARTPSDILNLLNEQITVVESQASAKSTTVEKARNVTYTLLTKPAKWSDTPQRAQIEKILFGNTAGPDGAFKSEFSEEEVFTLIRGAADRGDLRTSQSPVRVFKYYLNRMRADDEIRWG